MSYKTILTIWDGSDLAEARLNAAADLANRNDAHLTVLCFGVAMAKATR